MKFGKAVVCKYLYIHTVKNTIMLKLVAKYNIQLHVSALYLDHHLLSSRLLSKNLNFNIYIIIILPVVLYGCETWSLTLREEMKLRVFVNMVLRRIFGPRREEVTEEWRRIYNEQLNDFYSSTNFVRLIKSRTMRWAGHVALIGEEKGVYRVLLGKPERRRILGSPRRRWVDNIWMDLQEVECCYMDWIGLAEVRDS